MTRLMILAALVAVIVPVLALGAGATEEQENTNTVAYWCGDDEHGTKYEPVDTPFIVPEPAEGTVWSLLVIKAGSGEGENETWAYPTPGVGYSHSSGKDNSHVILCWEDPPDETTTTVADTTTTVADTTTTVADTTTTVADTTTTTVPAPTAVDSGGPVSNGPNVALLGLAGLLVLLSGGALALRLTR